MKTHEFIKLVERRNELFRELARNQAEIDAAEITSRRSQMFNLLTRRPADLKPPKLSREAIQILCGLCDERLGVSDSTIASYIDPHTPRLIGPYLDELLAQKLIEEVGTDILAPDVWAITPAGRERYEQGNPQIGAPDDLL